MKTTSIINEFMRTTKAARRLGRAMQSLAGGHVEDASGLNAKELLLLRAVEEGPCFPHELSDRTDTAAAVVTRTVDHLVELGYVVRQPDTVDRRRVALAVTEAGARASSDGWAALRGVIAHAFSDVPEGALARLAEDMEALSEAVEAKEAAGEVSAVGSPGGTSGESGGEHGGVSA